MNILYIHSHDTGRYISPFGHNIATPRLQKLAEDGVFFRKAFTVNPTCSPSRAALLTGQYPHCNGMLGLVHRGFSLKDYDRHLVRFLKSHGYQTALAGIQHEAPSGDTIGYDEVLCVSGTHKKPTAAAVEFLAQKHTKPFFLSVGYFETHKDFPKHDALDDPRHTLPPSHLPDTPAIREEFAGFKTSARQLDENIGAVLDALDANGLREDTLVICTTDHGPPLPGMKCNLTDLGTGVFLILRGPPGFRGGLAVDSMVTHLDIFPTICEAGGLPPPPGLQGKSLLPLLENPSKNLHSEIFGEINYHAAYEPQRCIRTERYKYIRRFDNYPAPVLPNCDDGEAKTCLLEHGWKERPVPTEQLYDLLFDPQERNNLAGQPENREILRELRERLEKWMSETNDPILMGPIQIPQNAVITKQSALSPVVRN